MQIVEADQVDILVFTVAARPSADRPGRGNGFSRELRRKLRKLDRLDGVDLDLAFVHTVTGADPYAWTTPNANAAGSLSPTDSFAKTFGEDHAKSLHPAGWNAGSADGNVSWYRIVGPIALSKTSDPRDGVRGERAANPINTAQGNRTRPGLDDWRLRLGCFTTKWRSSLNTARLYLANRHARAALTRSKCGACRDWTG
jgi:hypothetical protein